MKKVLKLVLAIFAMMMVATAAIAAEPLAYGDETMQVGPVFQHTVLDTNLGKLKGNEYGIKYSFMNPNSGYAGHMTVSHADLKGAYDEFGNSLKGGSPTVTLELSKIFEKFESGWQIGFYTKYQRYLDNINGGEGAVDEFRDEFGDIIFTETWSDQTKIKNLQIIEAGILFQKDIGKWLQVYAGPMLQVIKADFSYSYRSDLDAWDYQEKVMAKSGLGAVAGAVLKLNRDFSVKAGATVKEHTTVGGALNYAFEGW